MPLAFAATVSLEGLKLQAEFAGSALHAKVNVPLEPLLGAINKLKLAVCPLETVWLGCPPEDREKSKPMPVSAAVAFAGRAGLETVRNPPCWPAVLGENAICTPQFAPGSREAPHVVEDSANPADTDNTRFERGTGPLFVSNTLCAALVLPTPVDAKARDGG